MVLCFIDCIHKNTKGNKPNIPILKTTSINDHSTISLTKPKHSLTLLPMKTKNFYDDNSSTNQYKSLIPPTRLKPIMPMLSSNSHSSSSIDSTTRANTAHNRAISNTYTYVALNTSDDFMPADIDDSLSNSTDGKKVELMMTTV